MAEVPPVTVPVIVTATLEEGSPLPTWVCSMCLYLGEPTHDNTHDDRLTVINGQMVCAEHAGHVAGAPHSSAVASAR